MGVTRAYMLLCMIKTVKETSLGGETKESTGKPMSHGAIWIMYLGIDWWANEPFEWYTFESNGESTSHSNMNS